MNSQIDFTQTDTSGFYNSEFMLRAGKFVYTKDFGLVHYNKDAYAYPVHGWTWYDSAEEAVMATGTQLNDWNLDLVDPVLKPEV